MISAERHSGLLDEDMKPPSLEDLIVRLMLFSVEDDSGEVDTAGGSQSKQHADSGLSCLAV